MGPTDETQKSADFTKTPFFNVDGDFSECRKLVYDWVETMKESHDKGADRRFKTKFRLLGRFLYSQGIDGNQRSLADEEI